MQVVEGTKDLRRPLDDLEIQFFRLERPLMCCLLGGCQI